MKLLARIAAKVFIRDDGCWEWTGSRDRRGYGRISVQDFSTYAHRALYEITVERVAGFDLDHLCRNTWCVNPDHLEPVTHQENVNRGDTGKHFGERTHCPQGHPYDEANTYRYRGGRYCRACRNETAKRWKAKQCG